VSKKGKRQIMKLQVTIISALLMALSFASCSKSPTFDYTTVTNPPAPKQGNVKIQTPVALTVYNQPVVVSGACASGVPISVSGDIAPQDSQSCINGKFSFSVSLFGLDGSKKVIVEQDSVVNGFSLRDSDQVIVTKDTTAPTLALSPPQPAWITKNIAATVTVTQSDSTLILPSDGYVVSYTGTASACSVTGSGQVVSITGCLGDGTAVVSIPSGVAKDAAGNSSLATQTLAVNVKNSIPNLLIEDPTHNAVNKLTPVAFNVITSADALSPFTVSYVRVTYTGTVSCTPSVSQSQVVLTNCLGDGTASIKILAGAVQDIAGNLSAQTIQSTSVIVDNTPPPVTIGSATVPFVNSSAFSDFQVSYGGIASISLAASDVTVVRVSGNATCLVSIQPVNIVRLSSCTGDGVVSISLRSGTARDEVGNLSIAAVASSSFTVDNTPPTLSIGTPSKQFINAAATVVIPVTALSANSGTINNSNVTVVGFTIGGCQWNVTGSFPSWLLTISGCLGDGPLGLSFSQGLVTDLSSNKNITTVFNNVLTVDNTRPVISISAPTKTLMNVTASSVFSVSVTTGDTMSISSSNVSAIYTGSASCNVVVAANSVTLSSCSGDGSASIRVAAADAIDAALNTSLQVNSLSITIDNTPPVITGFGTPSVTQVDVNGTVTIPVNYTGQSSISLKPADVTINTTAGSLSCSTVSTSGNNITISGCTGDGRFNLSLAAGTASDDAGNKALSFGPANPVITVENTPPVAVVNSSGLGASPSNSMAQRTITVSGTDVFFYKAVVVSALGCSGADFSNAAATDVSTQFTFTPVNNSPNTVCVIGQDISLHWQSTPTASSTLVIDTIPPLLTITSVSDGVATNSSTKTIAGACETGATLSISGSGLASSVSSTCSGSSYSLLITFSPGEGTKSFSTVATDAANNATTISRTLFKGCGQYADIARGSVSSNPSSPAVMNGKLYFFGADAIAGTTLYSTDGSSSGISTVASGVIDTLTEPMTVVNNNLYFVGNSSQTGREIWTSDGTTFGTALVKDISGDSTDGYYLGSVPSRKLISSGGKVYYFGTPTNNGSTGTTLWSTDGTSAGTALVKDVCMSPTASPYLFGAQGKLFFGASNCSTSGQEPWVSDGTSAGTVILGNLNTATNGSSFPTNFASLGSNIYFMAASDGSIYKMYKTDGISPPTAITSSTYSRAEPSIPSTVSGSFVYFVGYDSLSALSLFKTDGTTVSKITHPEFSTTAPAFGSITDAAGTLYFRAMTSSAGTALFRLANGSVTRLTSISPGLVGTNPILGAFGNYLFFAATDSTGDNELYRYDPSSNSVSYLKDINPGLGSNPSNPVSFNSSLYFQATASGSGAELWVCPVD
jgi:ELWxxDGT repeat protein